MRVSSSKCTRRALPVPYGMSSTDCQLSTRTYYSECWTSSPIRQSMAAQPRPDKSVVMVVGETARMRDQARESRRWLLEGRPVQEVDEQFHLGILRTVHQSSIQRILERCTSGRSAFFALNSVGSRFGRLHPVTSYRLYNTLSIPILLYGAELWTPTKTELNMLERVFLRTIQGLPTRFVMLLC